MDDSTTKLTSLPAVVDRATWQARAGRAAGAGEGAHPRRGRDRGGPAAAADGRGRRRHRADRPGRTGHAAGGLRGPQAADRLLPHVVRRPTRRGPVRGLHVLQRPGPRAVHTCTRATSRTPRSARARTRRASVPRLHGLGVPWYSAQDSADALLAGRAVRHVTWSATCATATGSSRPTGHRPRRRDDGTELRAAGHDRVRAPGDLGGLTRRLAAAAGTSRASTRSAPTDVPPPSGRASQPATPTTSAPRWAKRPRSRLTCVGCEPLAFTSSRAISGQECVDFPRDLGRVLEQEAVCRVGVDPDLRVRDEAGHQVAELGRDHQVAVALDDQRGI